MHTITMARPEPVDTALLASELADAGIPGCTVTWDGQHVSISRDETLPDDMSELVAGHTTDRQRQLDKLLVKARGVWRGDDTFTAGQAQKILAGIVLHLMRD